MANKGEKFVARLWLAACMLLMALPAATQAGEVDLSKAVEIQPGKGVAVFSITLHGATQDDSGIKWREVKEGKNMPVNWSGTISIRRGRFFGTEELQDSPRKIMGRFAALSLPPGTYEFYDFESQQAQGQAGGGQQLSLFHASRPFSRKFSVEAGKIQYVGNLDIYEGDAYSTTGGLMAGLFLGMYGVKIEIYPSLIDAGDEDIPLIIAKGNGMSAADITRHITVDDENQHARAVLDELQLKAEQGETSAQRRLLLGLQRGLVMEADGREYKVGNNAELQKRLAQQLSAKQVSGGDYGLAIVQEPKLITSEMDKLPADENGKKLLDEVLADAGRYFSPAMYMAFEMYGRGLPGVQEDREQSSLWRQRYQSLNEAFPKFVPYLDDAGKAEFKKFNSASNPRYFALSASGAYGLSTGDDASIQTAIAACEARNIGAAEHCRLYARNGLMDWEACPAGYEGPMANTFPPVTGIGKIDDLAHLPGNMGDNGKAAYREFLKINMPRAFAVADSGEAAMASGDCHAAYKALQKCQELSGKACKLYALDDQIVLGATDPKLVEEEQRIAALVEKAVQVSGNLVTPTLTAGTMAATTKN